MIVILLLVVFFGIMVLFALWLLKTRRMTLPFLYKHNQGYTIGVVRTTNPLDICTDKIDALLKEQFAMHPNPTIMADPFIVRHDARYYIFYEELLGKYCHFGGADIALLSSADGRYWKREGIVLHEPFHLSFPNVFQWNGDWYMLPEAGASKEMRLYKAKEFPYKWELCKVIMHDLYYADPMIYEQDGVWYLWYNTYIDGDNLVLYTSDSPLGEWQKHIASPIRTNGDDTRPAGRISAINGQLYYFVQEHIGGYGTGTIAYQVVSLSPTEFVDKRLDNNPILQKNGDGWMRDGMHHLSFVENEGGYWCVTDGICATNKWRIDWRNFPEFNMKRK